MDLLDRAARLDALLKLPNEVLVDAAAVGLLMDLAPITVQQRRNPIIPRPIAGLRVLRWQLGAVRAALMALSCPP